jgi:zinc/manganese transport system substrate-binding protein
MSRMRIVATAVVGVLMASAACASSGTAPRVARGKLRVVAAENFWGNLAAQLGGDHVDVTSIISSPDTDPHDYEPTPADARAIASADYVIGNGLGYDPWVAKLVRANPHKGRRVLDVGRLVGAKTGDNPHRWYYPAEVERVIVQFAVDFKALAPGDAAAFETQRDQLQSVALKPYKDAINQIRERYSGTPVGASESIFIGLAEATGLDLKTPLSFVAAISEGADPTAADKATADTQIRTGAIKVFVYNSQNATPDVQSLVAAATAAGVEVTTVTETLTPPTASFQDWQVRQLNALAAALGKTTGK